MSLLCDQVISVVRSLFPEVIVKQEHFVIYNGQKLFVDIFIPQLGIVIEVHGRQHDSFVEHFHGDEHGFKMSKRRDALKEEWACLNGYIMVVLREADLPITAQRLLEIIDERSNT